MTTQYTSTECSRLSSVIEKITNDVTRALEKNLGEIIENEKNVNNCLMNIPQIKQIADENIELKKANETLKSINKSIQEKNNNQGHTISGLQEKIKDLIEKGALKIDTGSNNDKKIIDMQKKCLIKLRKENQELKEELKAIQLNNNNNENNISLEVEEYETKKNDNTDQADFYDNVKENEILVDKIQLDNDKVNELFEEQEESETESSSATSNDDDDDDDNLMLEHWKKEREKLNNMNQYQDVNLAGHNNEEEEEEEEEEEVEEYELMINGEECRVYRSNTGNIYEILEDDEAGELMGTINDKGEFIEL